MDRFPALCEPLEDQRHAAGGRFRSAFVVLRLRPLASNQRTVPSHHVNRLVTHDQLHVLDLRIRAFPVLTYLLPASCHRPVVVEEIEPWIVPVNTGDSFNVRVTDAVEQSVECGKHAVRSGGFLC